MRCLSLHPTTLPYTGTVTDTAIAPDVPSNTPTVSSSTPSRRTYTWIYVIVGILAGITRFVRLGAKTDHGTPLFDEKHYVPQAWQLLQSTGDPISPGIEDNPGFGLVVHPPVAKQVLAIGEWIFGYNAWGWRFMSALAGVAVVLLLMDIVRRISNSALAVAIVGIYAVCDGVLFVSSRVGMLDIIQTLFIIGAVWALVIDNEHTKRQLAQWQLDSTGSNAAKSIFGPYLSYRWWRLSAGVLLGLSLGVKWSGLYYIAVFGLWSVFSDLNARRNAGVRRPILGALFRDTLPALRDLVVVSIGVYLLSWRSWFAEETSVYRHIPADKRELPPFTGWLPDTIQNYIHYQASVLKFHAELTTSNGHHHPWESKPWEWLISWRPMLYYSADTTCFGGRDCKSWIMLFGTPPIWWLLVPIMLWAIWCWVIRRDGRYSLAVLGFIASWVPWVISYDRQMYFFYATALIPFVLMAFAIVANDLIGWRVRGRRVGLFMVNLHAAFVVVAFVFWLPIMSGISIPEETFKLRFWLPRWN